MKVVAIIQARMGSARLPGKVLMDIVGKTMLSRCVERTLNATSLDGLIVATTEKGEDDPIADLCNHNGWYCYRGSEDDVLDRYYRIAKEYGVDVVVRITADCPLIDSNIIDEVVAKLINHQSTVDYCANTYPLRTYPRGLDVEVFRREALERAWMNALSSSYREHVTPYIYEHPDEFSLKGVLNDADYSELRWTVDDEEDMEFVREIYSRMDQEYFSWKKVIDILKDFPSLLEINRCVRQKAID